MYSDPDAFSSAGLLSFFSSAFYLYYSWPPFLKELLIKGCELPQILHIKLILFSSCSVCEEHPFLHCSAALHRYLVFPALSFFFFSSLPSRPAKWTSCQILFAQTDSYRGLGEKARSLHIHPNKQNQNVKAQVKYITMLPCQILLISPG